MDCNLPDVTGGRSTVVGTNSSLAANARNQAVDAFRGGYYCHFSQIQLSLSAADLIHRDVLCNCKNGHMAALYIKGSDGLLQELGRTEVVFNSLSPKWIRKINVPYQFNTVQNLVFRVYDVGTQFYDLDVKALLLEEQQFLGEASCTLSEIATKVDRTSTLNLVCQEVSAPAHNRKCCQLTVYAEESVVSETTVELILKCSDLESKDLSSKIDPFLVISKPTENGMLDPIWKTDVLRNDHDPKWKPIFLSIQQVGSKDTLLLIECFNFNNNGKHDLLGKVQMSLAELEKLHAAETGENLFILLSAGPNHQNKVLKSRLLVDKYTENIQHTFLDLNPMVAIDITGCPNAYQRVRCIPSESDRNRNIMVEKVSSIRRVLISILQPHPPLLPLTNTDSHSIVQNLQKLELGKLVFTLALTAILGLLYSQKLEDDHHASSPHYLIIVGFMVFCAVIWNGISFGATNPCLGNFLQLIGITLVLCFLCLLVGTFLPAGFSSACWLSAVLYLLPIFYILIKPHPGPYLQRFQS
ncbi:Calcium-dependent phospholipid-binding Copine family protein [Perilla frutescens var. hirtella]|nr:Calcium-dependent phospholipid-binding Copine family protein [Perilla frutescens var. hirtella]